MEDRESARLRALVVSLRCGEYSEDCTPDFMPSVWKSLSARPTSFQTSVSPNLYSTWRYVEALREKEYGLHIIAILIKRCAESEEDDSEAIVERAMLQKRLTSADCPSLADCPTLADRLLTLLRDCPERPSAQHEVFRMMVLEILYSIFSSNVINLSATSYWEMYKGAVQSFRNGQWDPQPVEVLQGAFGKCSTVALLLHKRMKALGRLCLLAGLRLEVLCKPPTWEELINDPHSLLRPHPFSGLNENPFKILDFLEGRDPISVPLPAMVTTAAAVMLVLLYARSSAARDAADCLQDGDSDVPPALMEAANGFEQWNCTQELKERLEVLLQSTYPNSYGGEGREGGMDLDSEESQESQASFGLSELSVALRDVFSVPMSTPHAFSTSLGFHPLEKMPIETLQQDLVEGREALSEALRRGDSGGGGGGGFLRAKMVTSKAMSDLNRPSSLNSPLISTLDAQWGGGAKRECQ